MTTTRHHRQGRQQALTPSSLDNQPLQLARDGRRGDDTRTGDGQWWQWWQKTTTQQSHSAWEREGEDAGTTASHRRCQPPPLQRKQSRSMAAAAMDTNDAAARQWGKRGDTTIKSRQWRWRWRSAAAASEVKMAFDCSGDGWQQGGNNNQQ